MDKTVVNLAKAHLRVARPTDKLTEVVQFYRDGLGFEVLYEFTDHDGFDGIMLGHKGQAGQDVRRSGRVSSGVAKCALVSVREW